MKPTVTALCLFSAQLGMVAPSAIDVAVDEKKRLNHVVDSLDLLLYVLLLIATILTVWLFRNKRVRFLHESGLAIAYGLVVGLIIALVSESEPVSKRVVALLEEEVESRSMEEDVAGRSHFPPDELIFKMNQTVPPPEGEAQNRGIPASAMRAYTYAFIGEKAGQNDEDGVREKAMFNPEIFFYVLLPPIIFHAGYSMRRKQFFDNIGAILALALVGTVISAFVIAGIMYGFAQLVAVPLRFLDVLYFGSILSATDPVTVLAIFHDLHVDGMLNGLVLGEALLNDAVALVLCSSIEEYERVSLTTKGGFEVGAFFLTVAKFFSIFLGSVGLGAGVAFITAILTKFTRVRDAALLETSLFVLMSYTSYLLAEISEMSGIVAVLFCGVFQAHYTLHNLSLESKQRTRQLFEALNFMAENFIFSYLGVSLFTFSRHHFDIIFILGAFVAVAVARAVNVYPILGVVNLGRKQKVPINFQHMLWFSGLRGAMAFALAVRNTVTTVRQLFFTTTCVIAITTVIFIGGCAMPAMSFLQIPIGICDEELDESVNLESAEPKSGEGGGDGDSLLRSHPPSRRQSLFSPTQRTWIARAWKSVDSGFLKPALTSATPSLVDTMPQCCLPLARLLTTSEQVSGRDATDVSQNEADRNFEFEGRRRTDSLSSGD